ncbi:glycosyltransferase family protein [Leucobacter chromiiresistens]|uniref:Spore protein YkvP/CgeB glycosyl transferase-like domain-containing protein n=1 Tax=Leucobacter chromiiresistens TaxID=1079994 RepID=A0A147EPK9_9MICO|nr:glycosyltransferase [Leucobacter chromiiresistens]KTR86489.1 hypothetical protein NS354_04565 [Leucobacter chromiiresistens]
MSGLVRRVVAPLQRAVAAWSFRRARRRAPEEPISWVIGPEETATMVRSMARGVPGSYTAVLKPHPFYSGGYDYEPRPVPGGWIGSSLRDAWVFGRLAARARGFIYVGPGGFLRAQTDLREFEFGFLKARGVKLVCYFTGSDIRSIPVMQEHERETGLPNIATYLPAIKPIYGTEGYDRVRRGVAEAADRHADLIFTAAVDQRGYLTRDTAPFRYFFPEQDVATDLGRFARPGPRVVVHAPSSPIIKGTQLVRAAVAALREEGLEFEYVELSGVPHEEVTAALERAHIVMNQFYAHMPGMFGVEAMAAGAVMLSSADERIETDLPAGSNQAWVVTRHHEVAERLREMLLLPSDELRAQAEAGQRWVREHATAEVSGAAVRALLDAL